MSGGGDDLEGGKVAKAGAKPAAKDSGGSDGDATKTGGMPGLGQGILDLVQRLTGGGDKASGKAAAKGAGESLAAATPEQMLANAKRDYETAVAEQAKLTQERKGLEVTVKDAAAQAKKLPKKKLSPEQEEQKKQLDEAMAKAKEQIAAIDEKVEALKTQKASLSTKIKRIDVKNGREQAKEDLAANEKKIEEVQKRQVDADRRLAEIKKLLAQKPPKGATPEQKEELAQQKAAAKKEQTELLAQKKTDKAELKEAKSAVGKLKENKGKAGSLWVNVNIAGPLSAAVGELKTRTGVDISGNGASALRGISDDGSTPGRIYCSWHKTGRAVDLSQKDPYLRVADGNKFRLYLPAKEPGAKGITGAQIGKGARNPYAKKKDYATMVFVDVTEVLEMHGFNRIPPNGGVLEWWHYELADGKTWYQAMIEMYPEDKFMPLLRQHVAAGIVKSSYLVQHGVPKDKLTAKATKK